MLDVEFAPLAGHPAALADHAHDAARGAAALDDARASLRQVLAALAGQRGTAVTSAAARLTGLDERLATCVVVLDAAASTLRRHAAALGDAQADANRAIADRAAALARESQCEIEADEARRSTWNVAALGSAAPGGLGTAGFGTAGVGPTGFDDAATAHLRLLAAERRLTEARADVAAAEVRWRAARDAKAEASRQAATGLGSFADVRAVRVAAAAGTTGEQYEASAAEGRRAAALLRPAATADRPGERRASRADVRALLASHHDDPAFWAAFWDRATPESLYLALGPDPADPGRVLDAGVRAALADGVAQWVQTATPAERRDFGRAVVEDLGDGTLGLTARSEAAAALLSAPLPEEVVAGAGDALDERWAAHDGDEIDLGVIAPLVVTVLAGYARHPRLAFDRLAPAGAPRVPDVTRRWFGTLPHGGWPDGGSAVADAFATAVGVGTSSPSRGDQRRAALLVSHATTAMPSGLLAGPGLSDAASARIARAYEPYVPSMGDATLAQSLNRQCDGDPAEPPPVPGVDEGVRLAPNVRLVPAAVQPTIDAFALRDVIAATSRTPEAADVWLGTTDRYADEVLTVATSGAYDIDTNPRSELVKAALSDIGAVAGAMQSETISTAESRAAARENSVTVAGIGSGIATIGRKAAVSIAETAESNAWAFLDTRAPVAEANTRVGATEDALYDQYAPAMFEGVVAHDLTLGRTQGEALTRNGNLSPGDGLHRQAFSSTFDDLSRAPEDEVDCAE
ncbi:hypothetical protein GCM10009809_16440 [Isoptericola hypogeus]|uniref:Uncharacterized protein n=1 Tax=Isoptericola hypogeus TaxID=300179 RepID=A0ABN2JC24_9MICO